MSSIRERLGGLWRPGIVWKGSAATILVLFFFFSATDIEPGEVALKVNNLTGGQTPISQAGWTLRLPWFQSVYLLDARPQTFLMKNQEVYDDLHGNELSVRASDGSNFHFTDTTIIFQLLPERVVTTVRDSGLEGGYIAWMKPVARSILRDEFGRESTIDVSNPTTYGSAANRAKRRLNEVLRPHGIAVSQLVTPRPIFNDDYEHAIEERNALGNELEVIGSNLDRAQPNRERRLAEVDQENNRTFQQTRAQLEAQLSQTLAEQAQAHREVDVFAIEQTGRGQASRSAAMQQAAELEGELNARYDARRAEIQAFSQQPVARVMQVLAQRLQGVTIQISPWSDDATPSRIRYEGTAP